MEIVTNYVGVCCGDEDLTISFICDNKVLDFFPNRKDFNHIKIQMHNLNIWLNNYKYLLLDGYEDYYKLKIINNLRGDK